MPEYDLDNLKYCLGIPQGRMLIWQSLAVSGLYQQPAAFGDTERTFFNCGRLNSGLALYAACMEASPELTAIMIKERGNYDNLGNSEPGKPERKPDPVLNAIGAAFDRFGLGGPEGDKDRAEG